MEFIEVFNQCIQIILPSIASIIAVIFGIIGMQLKTKYEQKVNNDTIKKIVDDVVKCIQQIYKDANGEKKLQEAIKQVSTILNEKGLQISETELRTLIESAVYGLKNSM